eukprot:2458319-Pleurochrysis_carterae.AAC.2
MTTSLVRFATRRSIPMGAILPFATGAIKPFTTPATTRRRPRAATTTGSVETVRLSGSPRAPSAACRSADARADARIRSRLAARAHTRTHAHAHTHARSARTYAQASASAPRCSNAQRCMHCRSRRVGIRCAGRAAGDADSLRHARLHRRHPHRVHAPFQVRQQTTHTSPFKCPHGLLKTR